MAKKNAIVVPEHFQRNLGYIRQWCEGFEAAGKKGPPHADVLRQVQLFLRDLGSDNGNP